MGILFKKGHVLYVVVVWGIGYILIAVSDVLVVTRARGNGPVKLGPVKRGIGIWIEGSSSLSCCRSSLRNRLNSESVVGNPIANARAGGWACYSGLFGSGLGLGLKEHVL